MARPLAFLKADNLQDGKGQMTLGQIHHVQVVFHAWYVKCLIKVSSETDIAVLFCILL